MPDAASRLAPIDTALVTWSSEGFQRISLIALPDGRKIAEWKQEELGIEPARSLFTAACFRDWHRNAYEFAAKRGLLTRE